MRRRDEQKISEVIHKLIINLGIEEEFVLAQTQEAWGNIMGKTIAKYTKKISSKNKILLITISSASARNELSLNKSRILSAIHKEIGKEYFKDINFL